MNDVRIEQANGATDGANHDFFTSLAYDLTASVQVFLNGLLLNPSQYMLTLPDHVFLVDAPRAGEVVQVYYRPS